MVSKPPSSTAVGPIAPRLRYVIRMGRADSGSERYVVMDPTITAGQFESVPIYTTEWQVVGGWVG
jgi:hypothetical protein